MHVIEFHISPTILLTNCKILAYFFNILFLPCYFSCSRHTCSDWPTCASELTGTYQGQWRNKPFPASPPTSPSLPWAFPGKEPHRHRFHQSKKMRRRMSSFHPKATHGANESTRKERAEFHIKSMDLWKLEALEARSYAKAMHMQKRTWWDPESWKSWRQKGGTQLRY